MNSPPDRNNDKPIFLVDRDSPYATEMFKGLGQVEFFENSNPASRHEWLAKADVLSVRSSTRVDESLLSECRNLKMLVTPVVGTDHIDFDAVAALGAGLGRDIPVHNAAGSTAQAVADWTIAAICRGLARMPGRVGVVGVGNVGSQVVRRLDLLRIPYVTCDPGRGDDPRFNHVPLTELGNCDVLTFHVPLTVSGQSDWPTFGMISRNLCTWFNSAPGCNGRRLIVNSSRGQLVDEKVFDQPTDQRPVFASDVFLNEPTPSKTTIAGCAVATPHIAGSGRYGKWHAAMMIREYACTLECVHPVPMKLPEGGLPERPRLYVDPDLLNDADEFKCFLDEISLLTHTDLSDTFKNLWPVTPLSERAALFSQIRTSGIRTEPVWNVAGN